jgi:hypothetical protein
LGIVVPERKAKVPVQAINGRCLKCDYWLALVVVRWEDGAPPPETLLIDNSLIEGINFRTA